MATPVTIKNIGRVVEWIDGTTLAVGATLAVDLDDEAVRAELRGDNDYVILPDSGPAGPPGPAGAPGPAGPPGADGADGAPPRNIAPDFFDFVAGAQVGDIRVVTIAMSYIVDGGPGLAPVGPATPVYAYVTDDDTNLELNPATAARIRVQTPGAEGSHADGVNDPAGVIGGHFVTNVGGVLVLEVDDGGVPDGYYLRLIGGDGISSGASFLNFV